MSANLELFINIDKADPVKKDVKQFDRYTGGTYYDKDGNEIEVYYRRHWIIEDYLISLNGIAILLDKLRKLFDSRNPSLSNCTSICLANNNKCLCVTLSPIKDKETLLVALEAVSEFFYDIFQTEVEF